MKKDLLPDFAKPFKTKGYDVRLVRGCYQLFKISSKRVPDKTYPVLTQEYVGTISPDKGLIPKKISSQDAALMVEFGLSNFILFSFKRYLIRSMYNNAGTIQTVYMGIIMFMYGHTQTRFVKLSYIGQHFIQPCMELNAPTAQKRIKRMADKITALFNEAIPDTADRDYLITRLKDIKVNSNLLKPSVNYTDDIITIFNKYGIKYE